ncbi:hypothetical protein JOF53_004630 [Crossiella equi]|uniref:Uncharacterized protein n=1 Tax=Crossiella equi TaxID=130796 RepID=A0ABS5AGQ5_9PSEU|nr:hypothetical protein [Crossiella equi]MBP2475758.1 hypothetical protein [Crossiella equi]
MLSGLFALAVLALPVLGLTGLVVGLVVVARKQQVRRDEEWAAASAHFGWQWVPADHHLLVTRFLGRHTRLRRTGNRMVRGEHRGRPFLAFPALRPDGDSSNLVVVLTLPLPRPCPELYVVRTRLRLFSFGSRPQVGDPQFDHAFALRCDVPGFAQHFLTPAVRGHMMAHSQTRELVHRIGPTDIVVWHLGRFEVNSVRWLLEYTNDLYEAALSGR